MGFRVVAMLGECECMIVTGGGGDGGIRAP